MADLRTIAPDLWEVNHPLRVMGAQLGRRTIVIRLPDGSLLLQSPGPVDATLKRQLDRIGRVSALAVPTNFHDTFVREALQAFPGVAFFAPDGFPRVYPPDRAPKGFDAAPDGWRPVLDWIRLGGMPALNEHVFLHRPTQSLLVADLVFNIGPEAGAWTRLLFRLNGAYNTLRPSRFLRAQIRDKAAFGDSVRRVMKWDFDRLVPGHGEIIHTGAKERLRREFAL